MEALTYYWIPILNWLDKMFTVVQSCMIISDRYYIPTLLDIMHLNLYFSFDLIFKGKVQNSSQSPQASEASNTKAPFLCQKSRHGENYSGKGFYRNVTKRNVTFPFITSGAHNPQEGSCNVTSYIAFFVGVRVFYVWIICLRVCSSLIVTEYALCEHNLLMWKNICK